MREGGREGVREGGREGVREGGREGVREGGREGVRIKRFPFTRSILTRSTQFFFL